MLKIVLIFKEISYKIYTEMRDFKKFCLKKSKLNRKLNINPTVSIANWMYGEEASTPILEGNLGKGKVTYTYSYDNEVTWVQEQPVNVGTYNIKANIEETPYYNKAECTNTFRIISLYERQYLIIESLSDNNEIGWKASRENVRQIISYSTDGTTWIDVRSSESGATLTTLNTGDFLYVKGNNNDYADDFSIYNFFTSTSNFSVKGNIMSLIYGDDFVGLTTLQQQNTWAFLGLFKGCEHLTSIENLILPATTLSSFCYHSIFEGCSNLTSIPSDLLPATTLASYCYGAMFANTGITTIPGNLLPVTTLANYCYAGMFSGTQITSIPSNLLPATVASEGCYENMFKNCVALVTVPELPITTLANYCYSYMFSGCTSLVTVPSTLLPNTLLKNNCYASMFRNCTALTTAPILPALTLKKLCYSLMFRGCTSLNYILCLAIDKDLDADTATDLWTDGVAASGIFVKNSNIGSQVTEGKISLGSWETGTSGIPEGWLVRNQNDNGIPVAWSSNTMVESINSTTKPKFINPLNISGFTFSSSDINVATIDNLGNVIYVLGGTCTLIASFTGNNDYPAQIFTCELTILSDNYEIEYFTIEPLTDGTIKHSKSGLQYSTDKITWTSLGTSELSVTQGQNVYLKGTMTPGTLALSGSNYYGIGTLSATGNINVSGNIMSLLYGSSFIGQVSLSGKDYAFYHLFDGNTYIINAQNLVLPATTLSNNCYAAMFGGCTSLVTTPILSATTLTQSCYIYMFKNCTALTIAPELPATTLANNCYSQMFEGCTSLNYIKCLATDISASNCTYHWIVNVASSGTFVKDSNMSSWLTTSTNGIPSGWMVENAE